MTTEVRHRSGTALNWQLKLLPVMTAVLVLMTVAFLVLSLLQTRSVQQQISAAPQLDLEPALKSLACKSAAVTVAEYQSCTRWQLLAVLEAHTLQRRYHQANVSLAVRAWIKYLGFLTGMILGLVGAVFILGRLTEAASNLQAEGVFGKLTIQSVSPGLILATLGTILMLTTIVVNPPTSIEDAPVYLTSP